MTMECIWTEAESGVEYVQLHDNHLHALARYLYQAKCEGHVTARFHNAMRKAGFEPIFPLHQVSEKELQVQPMSKTIQHLPFFLRSEHESKA